MPFGSGFLIFTDYAKGAIRLSSLMEIPALHIWTHDTISLGEDGPTHQPIEQLVALYNLPAKAVREQIASAVNVIVQASRLRDGSRKITHITEVMGMEGDIITLQDLFVFEFQGEDSAGHIIGRHRSTGIRPGFWDRARYFGRERDLADALAESHG